MAAGATIDVLRACSSMPALERRRVRDGFVMAWASGYQKRAGTMRRHRGGAFVMVWVSEPMRVVGRAVQCIRRGSLAVCF
jgi:hypothetical protein